MTDPTPDAANPQAGANPADPISSNIRQPRPRLDWMRLSIEVGAIVFGVVLGLGLNEWRASSREAAKVEQADEAIMAELSANYETILRARAYHLDQYKSASRLLLDPATDRFDYRGLSAPNTTRAALDAAIAAGHFAGIDPEDARQYMKLYNEIAEIDEVERRHAVANTSGQTKSYDAFLEAVSFAFSDLLYSEDDALHKLAPLLKTDPPEGWWAARPKIDAALASQAKHSDGGPADAGTDPTP